MEGWLPNSRHFFYKVVLCSVYWFFKIVYRHKIYGAENFYSGAAILAANHVSFYDPPVLSISTPYEVHFLARKTLFDVPIFSFVIRHLNAHPVSGHAQDVGVFKTMVRLMKEGQKVIMFPEGKRSVDGTLQPMKPGIAMLLARTGAAVIPAYLHGTFSIWPKHKKFPSLRGSTACVFGKPLHFPPKAPPEEVAKSIEEAVTALREWYEKGAKGPIP